MARTISLKGSDLSSGETAKMRSISFRDASSKSASSAKVLATAEISVDSNPDGSADNAALKWNEGSTPKQWEAVKPVHATNDEQTGDLSTGDRVVTGLKTGPDGSLLQLETRPLGAMGGSGGLPSGYSEGTVIVAAQYDPSSHKLQIKTATSPIKDGTTSGWIDVITFGQFDD